MRRFQRDEAGARKRSANGHKAKAAGNLVVVDGESVSLAAMAERLGVSQSTANKRLRVAQGMDGPVTWAKLEGKG